MTVPPLFSLLFICCLIFGSFFYYRNRSNKLQSLSQTLGTKTRHNFLTGGFVSDGIIQGRKFSIQLETGGGYGHPLIIEVEHSVPFMVWIYKAHSLSGWADTIATGKKERIETEDIDFDRVLQVYSNQTEEVKKYLSNQMVRETILSVFQFGYDLLELDVKQIRLTKAHYNLKEDLNPDVLTTVVKKLLLLPAGETVSLNLEAKARYSSNLLWLGNLNIVFAIVGGIMLMNTGFMIFMDKFTFWRGFFCLVGMVVVGYSMWLAWYCEKIKVGK